VFISLKPAGETIDKKKDVSFIKMEVPIKVYNDKKEYSQQELEKESTFKELYTDADEKDIDLDNKKE